MDYRALAESIELFGATERHCVEDRPFAERYLAAVAPLLASMLLGKSAVGAVRKIDRLLAHSRPEDPAPFEPALAKWREFRDTCLPAVLGDMTVNERLDALSLTDDYDRAVDARDAGAVRTILETADMDTPSIDEIASRVAAED